MKTYIEIRDAQGGRDAKLLVNEMADMFQRSASINNFQCQVEHWREGFVVLWLTGKGADKFYKKEAGIHQWVRVPPTEKRGRVHTSTVTVAVMNQKRVLETKLNQSEIRRHYSKASTKGGQNANKNENCVSLHHVPTDIRVVCKDTKSKTKNEEKAMIELTNRVHEFYQGKIDQKHSTNRREQINDSNSKKRTYKVTEGYALDHDTNKRVKIKDVMKGKLNLFYK